jgi:hypothetical protein
MACPRAGRFWPKLQSLKRSLAIWQLSSKFSPKNLSGISRGESPIGYGGKPRLNPSAAESQPRQNLRLRKSCAARHQRLTQRFDNLFTPTCQQKCSPETQRDWSILQGRAGVNLARGAKARSHECERCTHECVRHERRWAIQEQVGLKLESTKGRQLALALPAGVNYRTQCAAP